jgi:hypothetical protein
MNRSPVSPGSSWRVLRLELGFDKTPRRGNQIRIVQGFYDSFDLLSEKRTAIVNKWEGNLLLIPLALGHKPHV